MAAWLSLLARVGGPVDADFVDWLAVDRIEGREYDIGLHRHWLDPTRPFAEIVLKPAHGALVTSATLTGGGRLGQLRARRAVGAPHLARAATRFEAPSPFDYADQAEVLIVTDVKRGDIGALANAYARLIVAAGGGTLGLFTAIRRLRGVHARIADRLAREGLPLHAQHVDPIDTGTLVDIFRDDPRASLLGTDALRDGVDVPGDSLRLVVMEGVPWPKPTVLHAARRLAGGGSAYDDRLVRARLAQAFGRLIRRADDRGAFVMLSAAMPSRLLTAFPPGVADRARDARRGGRAGRVAAFLARAASGHEAASGRADGDPGVKTLTLLRHAKSGWDDPVARDFDRPLNAKGQRAAHDRSGGICAALGLAFDHVVASPAVRVVRDDRRGRDAAMAATLAPAWDRRIYLASAATLLDVVRELPGCGVARADGRAQSGAGGSGAAARARRGSDRCATRPRRNIPTATRRRAARSTSTPGPTSAPGGATLTRFIRPRDLDPTLGPDAD